MLGKFSPKETSFNANLKDGRTVELFLRPYSLADMAWAQNTFKTEQDTLDIMAMKVVPISKILWNQLKGESKRILMEFKFVKEDEEGNKIDVKPEGYERLLESLSDLDSLIRGYVSYSENMELNGFLPEDSKKKTIKKK